VFSVMSGDRVMKPLESRKHSCGVDGKGKAEVKLLFTQISSKIETLPSPKVVSLKFQMEEILVESIHDRDLLQIKMVR
jgi:hypothetical protein